MATGVRTKSSLERHCVAIRTEEKDASLAKFSILARSRTTTSETDTRKKMENDSGEERTTRFRPSTLCLSIAFNVAVFPSYFTSELICRACDRTTKSEVRASVSIKKHRAHEIVRQRQEQCAMVPCRACGSAQPKKSNADLLQIMVFF